MADEAKGPDMAIKQVKINVNDLTIGMYVSQLDRPWAHTSFPLQGFQVRTTEDIHTLGNYCDYVYIDTTKGESPLSTQNVPSPKTPGDSAVRRPPMPGRRDAGKGVIEPSPLVIRKGVYSITVSLRAEMRPARIVIKQLQDNLTAVAKQLARGRLGDYAPL